MVAEETGGVSHGGLSSNGSSTLAFLYRGWVLTHREQARQVVMQFLKDKGAQFRMIDDEMIENSHRIASELGVAKDEVTGKFFVSAGEQEPKKDGTEKETSKGAEKEDGSPEREQDREKSPREGDASGDISRDAEDKI